MRIIFFLLFTFLLAQPALSQQPTKKEMQAQMLEEENDLKSQIADLEKQIETAKKDNPSEVEDLQKELKQLKQQLALLQGVNKGISGMSDKTFQQAAEEESLLVPKKDVIRINALPKKILSEAEMVSFVRTVHTEVEKIIPAAEKAEALEIYNETKEKYNSTDVTGNAASGCWMYGHWEKALYIMGRACLDDMNNTDNLNNYAAFLTMTGGEQAALPILQWLNKKYPKNSTILNNIGQAWFGLGDMTNSKKWLDSATLLYGNHSMANASLSKIYRSEGDSAKAIAFLRKSIKENYDPEKEAELFKLGVELTYADMPEFNYPMKKDPFGILSLINIIPEEFPSKILDREKVDAINRFLNGVDKLGGQLFREDEVLEQKLQERSKKIASDIQYAEEFIEPHNTPACKLAIRSFQLLMAEKNVSLISEKFGSSPMAFQLLFPFPKPFADIEDVTSPAEIIKDCIHLWEDSVLKPIKALLDALAGTNNPTCNEINAKMNAFLAKKASIESNGVKMIKQRFKKKSRELDYFIRIELYSAMDKPPISATGLADDLDLISSMEGIIHRRSILYNETLDLLHFIQLSVRYKDLAQDACAMKAEPDNTNPGEDDLAPLVVTEVKCEFIKIVSSPVTSFELKCNTIIYNPNSKIKKRKPNVPKGAAQNGKRRNQTRGRGPLNNVPGGPSSFFYEWVELEIINQISGPLNAEDKDLSQFSIEYDKWGNLVGLNIQLNKDGTALADPDSQDTGMDSRWSWNAAGLPVKGFLNKLLIRKQ